MALDNSTLLSNYMLGGMAQAGAYALSEKAKITPAAAPSTAPVARGTQPVTNPVVAPPVGAREQWLGKMGVYPQLSDRWGEYRRRGDGTILAGAGLQPSKGLI